ncbi:hypothetical protein MKX01_028182 [Papaver californicum]|nr:hypothetical protein MKX01_028182 [Papaver californicum]
MLLGDVFGNHMGCCRLKNKDAFVNFGVIFNNAMMGEEAERYVDCLLSVTKKMDAEGTVTGLFCILQTASQELQQALHVQHMSEQTAIKRVKELTYIKRQIRNPLSGIIFSRKMMEGTELDDEQRQLLLTSMHCQCQLSKVLDETDPESIMDGYWIWKRLTSLCK